MIQIQIERSERIQCLLWSDIDNKVCARFTHTPVSVVVIVIVIVNIP